MPARGPVSPLIVEVLGRGGAGGQAGSGMCRSQVNALAIASAQGQCSARCRNTLRWLSIPKKRVGMDYEE